MSAPFSSDLIELIQCLAASGAKVLVVGGHAVGVHAAPRATKDLDLWIGQDEANRKVVVSALKRFGVPAGITDALAVAKETDIIWFGRAPNRVDLIQSLPGCDFETAWSRRITFKIDDVEVAFIAKGDLINNKRTVGREQDLRDVEALSK